jgi:hypothetical protein
LTIGGPVILIDGRLIHECENDFTEDLSPLLKAWRDRKVLVRGYNHLDRQVLV